MTNIEKAKTLIGSFETLDVAVAENDQPRVSTAGDGKFVVFRLDNIKCMKYNFYSAPQEIK